MDIVYINQTFGLGGAEQFNLALANYLSQKNRLHFYTNSKILQAKAQNLNSHLVPFSVDLIGDWKGFVKGIFFLPFLLTYYLYIIYRHKNSQIFYFTGFIEKILCTPILKFLNKKVVWIEFGPLDPVITRFLNIPKILYRLSANFPDKVIFPSKNSLDKNRDLFPKNIPLLAIPLGSPPPPQDIPKIPSFAGLCISRLELGKGQDLLIRAWPKKTNAKLIIIGTGDQRYTKTLKKMVASQKNIELLGYVKNIYPYLKACQFTIFPSVWPLEGFGLVITESFSFGKPVIAFNHPPGSEIIKHNYNGLLGRNLSQNIQKLLHSPALSKKLGQNALKTWRNYFREDLYLKKYADSLLH